MCFAFWNRACYIETDLMKGGVRVAWFVYVLQCGDGSLYTGYTDDVLRRLTVHQSGKGAKYTRSHLPVKLVYQETCLDKPSALRRESAIKRLTRQQKLALIGEWSKNM